VLELDILRLAQSGDIADKEAGLVSQWILSDPQIWITMPLVHFGRLAGVIILTRPIVSRTLDWEDFDLLRVVGRQVASYLAEAQVQEELSEAQRFDEFNRRFAFIMHDIKNLVSQLSLVTRNAERHADNPEFRADMIETLKSSTARMNALLAKLSQHNKSKPEDPRLVQLAPVLRRVVAAKTVQHPVLLSGEPDLWAIADPARLEQALSHLVQNAIEASAHGDAVTIDVRSDAHSVHIDVIDRGCGMSAAFVDSQLFKPFTSTKEGGFGIGTYEARSDIVEMGGNLRVNSRSGSGTTFIIELPNAPSGAAGITENRALAA
jgi:putative PEP-CTERM system histidine kinase